MCSQTTIQSNSSSPLTEEPSVDSAGFQISWLSMISQLPALSFYIVAYFSLSPGMVMQLHSFLQEHPDATMEQIDNILDGNLCRWIAYLSHFFIFLLAKRQRDIQAHTQRTCRQGTRQSNTY